jgi:hypothetical protein
MKARFGTIILAVTALLATVGPAQADPPVQANGTGQTPLSASLGFNAQEDLSGSLNYNGDPQGPNADFEAHCNDFDSFALESAPGHHPKVVVSATCEEGHGQDVQTVYLWASFVDRGEPGTRDSVCICWTFEPIARPTDGSNCYISDKGRIQSGNIQIHT